MDSTTYLARTAGNGDDIALSPAERATHMHVIGATGMGKSTLLKSIIAQDVASGDGLMLIDPHGDLAEYALDVMPSWRTNQVCYLAPFDLARPVALNILECHDADARPQAAENVIAALRGIWPDSWGPRMEDILRYSLLALIAMPGASLAMLRLFLTDTRYRARVLAHGRDPFTRGYFAAQYNGLPEAKRQEWINPILNKVGAFVAAPALRNILGQASSTLDLAHVMARRQIVIANLAKGRLGDDPATYLGALLIGHLKTAVMARAALTPEARLPFHLIVDEVQLFGTEVLPSLYSEARKYGLSITAANQHTGQLSQAFRESVLNNAGTLAAFRVGPDDAELLARKFQCDPSGFLDLGVGELAVNGRFARTYAPPPPRGRAAAVKARSAERYGRPRVEVEARLARALQQGATA